jgi:hypothetical protein
MSPLAMPSRLRNDRSRKLGRQEAQTLYWHSVSGSQGFVGRVVVEEEDGEEVKGFGRESFSRRV